MTRRKRLLRCTRNNKRLPRFTRNDRYTLMLALAILLILPQLFFASLQSTATLIDIKLERPGDRLNVQIEITGIYSFRSFVLEEPNRLVIDLDQVLEFHCPDRIEVIDFGIKNIRVGKNQPQITRVIFDLEESPPSYRIGKNEAGILVSFLMEKEKEEIPIKIVEQKIPAPKTEKKPTQAPVKIPQEISEKLLKTIARITQEEKKIKIGFGIHSGLFFPFDEHIKDNYDKSFLFPGGEVAMIFPLKDSSRMGLSLSFLAIKKVGSNPEEYTKLQMTPVSLSISYMNTSEKVTPYIGGGIDYINYSENSPLDYEEGIISRKVFGANLQVGIYIKSTSFLSLKIYTTVHFARLKEDLFDINMGRVESGLSLCFFF